MNKFRTNIKLISASGEVDFIEIDLNTVENVEAVLSVIENKLRAEWSIDRDYLIVPETQSTKEVNVKVLYDGENEQYSFTLNSDDTVNFYINNKYMDTVDDLDISKGLLVAVKELLNCWKCKVLKIEVC